MTKLFKLTAVCAMLLGAFVSCTDTEPTPPNPLATPAGLTPAGVTATGATLTWDIVEGATRYNVKIGDEAPVTISVNSYAASELTPQTQYSWTVQAFNGQTQSEWSEGAVFTTSAATLGEPANLTATDITDRSAKLGWDAVEWASGYEVKIDRDDPIAVSETGYELVGLKYATKYKWAVRAVDGDNKGEWTVNSTFTTTPEQFVSVNLDNYFGSLSYGPDIKNMSVSFHSYYDEFDRNGYDLTIDLLATTNPEESNEKYIQLPVTTYPFTYEGGANTILIGAFSYLEHLENGQRVELLRVVGGEMTIEWIGSDEHITFTAELSNGETFVGEWNGPLLLRNPFYVAPFEDRDFGTFRGITECGFYPDPFGNGKSDVWGVMAYDGDLWIQNQKFMGTGKILRLYIHFPVGSALTKLPDGEYPIGDEGLPGTAQSSISIIENSKIYSGDDIVLVSGSVTSTYSQAADEYTIVIDGYNARGESIKLTIQGNRPTM